MRLLFPKTISVVHLPTVNLHHLFPSFPPSLPGIVVLAHSGFFCVVSPGDFWCLTFVFKLDDFGFAGTHYGMLIWNFVTEFDSECWIWCSFRCAVVLVSCFVKVEFLLISFAKCIFRLSALTSRPIKGGRMCRNIKPTLLCWCLKPFCKNT